MLFESTIIILLAAIFYIIIIYNRLVTLRNRFKNNFSQIDVQLQRRHELIPNLVNTAKQYMKHERETLEAVISARNQAVNANQSAAQHPDDPNAMAALVGAESVLTASLGKLFALVENYPELKADQTMSNLMEELSSTENRVANARQHYNDSVMAYNTQREQFPQNIVASKFNFKEAKLFELDSAEYKRPINVSFD